MTNNATALQVDICPAASGAIGLTSCPGEKPADAGTNAASRDLASDVAAIRAWRPDLVLTLMERGEMEQLGVSRLPEALRAAVASWHHLPIRDMSAPDARFLASWKTLSPAIHDCLERGGRVLVHCRGGLGRSGTVAALILVERGLSAAQAMARVRAARPGAIEVPEQEYWLRERAVGDSARGALASLLWGAAGDALGADIEFRSLDNIRARFPNGVNELPVIAGIRGAITDDTQMTLFTAEGLAQAREARLEEQVLSVHAALRRWFGTQRVVPQEESRTWAGLFLDPRLHATRAPGNTCLTALRGPIALGRPARNNSKGCGTIMRVAPCAFAARQGAVFELAMRTSALTHGHPTGAVAAAIWAEMLAAVAGGADLEAAAGAGLRHALNLGADGIETAAAIERALAAPRDGRPETVESVGAGWIAEEALAVALYTCLSASDAEQGLKIAVTHSGDSDSTGAIAGNMLGLMFADAVLAHAWAEQVQCADLLSAAARSLAP